MTRSGARRLTLAQARRTAVAAQGLAAPRPERVTAAHLQRLVDRIGLLQIDSVNVLARAHLLPVLARLGPYDPALLTRFTSSPPRRLVETWAHEASYVPPAVYHDLAWWRRTQWNHRHIAPFVAEHHALLARVRAVVAERGPATAREVEAALGATRSRGGWWEWSESKRALEVLFRVGDLASAGRSSQFERRYDLAERVIPPLPPRVAEREEPEATRELVRRAARALGVGTTQCLRDYYRLGAAPVRAAIAELVEEGELEPVEVAGWGPAFLHAAARTPRAVSARALLAPFDPLVFERSRLLALFGMHYRIGVYTPAPQRTHGYYVLPFLLGEHLVARIDLKADRAGGRLLVAHAHLEPPGQVARGARAWPAVAEVSRELAAELGVVASWLGLPSIDVAPAAGGGLVPHLASALAERDG